MDTFSRTQIKGFIERDMIIIHKKEIKPAYRLSENEEIFVDINIKRRDEIKPEKLSLKILHEDSSIIVVNKEAGCVVHPGAGNSIGTLANGIAYYFKNNSIIISYIYYTSIFTWTLNNFFSFCR